MSVLHLLSSGIRGLGLPVQRVVAVCGLPRAVGHAEPLPIVVVIEGDW